MFVNTKYGRVATCSGIVADFYNPINNRIEEARQEIKIKKAICWGCGAYFNPNTMLRCKYCGGSHIEDM